MRLLLDTHYLIWMTADPRAIDDAERRVIYDEGHALLVSPISIMEIRIKWQKLDRNGAHKGDVHPQQVLDYIERTPISLAVLTGADCAATLDVPLAQRDPFDEMLLIHAQLLGAKLLTRDAALTDHPLAYRFG